MIRITNVEDDNLFEVYDSAAGQFRKVTLDPRVAAAMIMSQGGVK